MRRSIKLFSTLAVIVFTVSLFAQETSPKHKYDLYFHWGYNRAKYAKSDIHFKGGEDFDFTLYDVESRDVPEKYNSKSYLNPGYLTIPQFNFRIGVRMDDKWSLSFGWDHLKYYVFREQDLRINGFIGAAGGDFMGEYDNEVRRIPQSMLWMEHTDGLNFIHLNLDRFWNIYTKKWFKTQLVTGVGTGPVCPWTDTRLFGTMYRNPSIHFAGWGVSVNAAPRVTLWDRFFVEGMFRVGYINLWNTMIIRDKWTSSQQIKYYEHNITAGFIFPLNPSKNGSRTPAPPAPASGN